MQFLPSHTVGRYTGVPLVLGGPCGDRDTICGGMVQVGYFPRAGADIPPVPGRTVWG